MIIKTSHLIVKMTKNIKKRVHALSERRKKEMSCLTEACTMAQVQA
ncbi:hypothetical protein SCIP_0655 [Scardovia inopinata JCM 12537]|nr:hypothetical protein SCIP_0655 [Scardovia inopinata JCM 12537]